MSDHAEAGPDQAFFDRADAYIHLANEQCEQISRGKVSSSLLYAAARFNAFVVASRAKNSGELWADKTKAVKYFTGQYQKMLEENLGDYIAHFDEYIGKGEAEDA